MRLWIEIPVRSNHRCAPTPKNTLRKKTLKIEHNAAILSISISRPSGKRVMRLSQPGASQGYIWFVLSATLYTFFRR